MPVPPHRPAVPAPTLRLPGAALLPLLPLLLLLVQTLPQAADLPATPSRTPTARQFEREIRPLLDRYCLECHSTAKHKGDLDLERFTTLAEVLKHPKVWESAADQLGHGEMPPKDKPQPSAAEKERLNAWIAAVLEQIGRRRAGDPGPVILRRLSNAEYTYTIRDLTEVDLDPAREFPVDGAAGEGFMNTGSALVMSPALLTKYLDAAKGIAAHAVLLPDGFRFSPGTTRRDWTDEIVRNIREFYARFTDTGGGTRVNLQGIVYDTNTGGRLPLSRYLAALVEERDALVSKRRTVASIAQARDLNVRYLGGLLDALNASSPSLLLAGIRDAWRTAQPTDTPGIVATLTNWQQTLWTFNSVGHIGKLGGPKSWMQAVNPIQTRSDLRLKFPDAPTGPEITAWLAISDAGDGANGDLVVWEQPRLVAPGRPDILLRDLPRVASTLAEHRRKVFTTAAACLEAVADAADSPLPVDPNALASRHGVDPDILGGWLAYLGIGSGTSPDITGHLTNRIVNAGGYEFVRGWGTGDTPNLVANPSDRHVRIPGNLKPHSVAMHPSPTLRVAVGWRSPLAARLRVAGQVTHAHPECGNGVTWSLEVRRGSTRQRLAAGTAQGSRDIPIGPVDNLPVRPGDLVSLLVGPRDGNHACDLTAIDLTLTSGEPQPREWNLARDVSPNVDAGNPHADGFGQADVWHFYTEPESGGGQVVPVIPPGSLLARWLATPSGEARKRLAAEVQQLLLAEPQAVTNAPDAQLRIQIAAAASPLMEAPLRNPGRPPANPEPRSPQETAWGIRPDRFGRHPDGRPIAPESLCLAGPARIEIRLPSELVAGRELVGTAVLHAETGREGSVQVQLLAAAPSAEPSPNPHLPVLVHESGPGKARFEAAFDDFRRWFPAALCYTRIVPVDEVVTLTLFHREDEPLRRLMLDGAQAAELDRLWASLRFVSQDALTLVDAYAQLMEYATQDADPKVFEPLRQPIQERAAAFRQQLVAAEAGQLDALLAFAARAYRRPLTDAEGDELRNLYRRLRGEEIPHDEAFRLTLARVFIAPAFLYRLEKPAPGSKPGPVDDWEIASRLSYFLWSSLPDPELQYLAGSGRLRQPDVLATQARRMSRDPRVRRLATEFGCQWLHVHAFDELDEKSERHFPTFAGLRGAMYEETIRFFTDLFQSDASVLSLLNADHTFLNEPLAAHYGIPGVTGDSWQRVDGVHRYGRGGILAFASTLAKQSGASRTSPILRGNWVSEVLLGEKLPRPPKDVPRLPEDEAATEGLTVRQLVEKHSSDPRCASCHARIDGFGFALESFDAIGRRRDRDLGNRPIDTRSTLMDGTPVDGLEGLRGYLLGKRRDSFVRQFCRKLAGYALGRGVQLSDGPLLAEMAKRLRQQDYRVSAAIDVLVRSPQFREIRGAEFSDEN